MSAKFVLSKSKVNEYYDKIKSHSDLVSYSLKTNYEVGELLEESTDCLFSVHSSHAAKLVKNNKRVLFFSQGWNKKKVHDILKSGINKFVVDNQQDLDVLLSVIEDVKINIELFLRMRLKEHTVHTGKHFVFGFYSKIINKLLPELKDNKFIDKLGVHFHRKTQNVSEWNLKEELNDSLSEKSLDIIDFVNIGGGLPSKYKNARSDLVIGIFSKIDELKKWLNGKNIQMIIEPGRYIAAPSVKLVSQVINVYDDNIIVDSSVYNSAMDTFIAHVRLLIENEKESGEYFTIKGCTPDSLDIFRYKVYLDKPKVGDKIIFLNAGAYNFTTEFCQLPKLKTEVIG